MKLLQVISSINYILQFGICFENWWSDEVYLYLTRTCPTDQFWSLTKIWTSDQSWYVPNRIGPGPNQVRHKICIVCPTYLLIVHELSILPIFNPIFYAKMKSPCNKSNRPNNCCFLLDSLHYNILRYNRWSSTWKQIKLESVF